MAIWPPPVALAGAVRVVEAAPAPASVSDSSIDDLLGISPGQHVHGPAGGNAVDPRLDGGKRVRAHGQRCSSPTVTCVPMASPDQAELT